MNWAYIAGYFDGEGHVRCRAAPSRPSRKTVLLSWANTHLGSLEAMRAFMRCGRISVKPMTRGMRKPGGTLTVSRVEDLIRVGKAMLPHLLVKQEAMAEMLEYAIANVRPLANWKVLTNAGVEEIARLYHVEGLTQKEIAKRYGVTDGAVSTFMVRQEIKGRRTGPKEGAYGILAKHGKVKILEMFEGGMTYGEIAEFLGVRHGTVAQWFWSHGIKLTKRIRKARANRATLTDGNA